MVRLSAARQYSTAPRACQNFCLVRMQSQIGLRNSNTAGTAPAVPDHYPQSPPNAVLGGRAVPALPCAGGLPRNAPLGYATLCARPQLVCQQPGDNSTVRARLQLVCQSQRVYANVPARPQLVADAPVVPTPPCPRDSNLQPTRQLCRRHRACAAPAVRITTHESRITAVPDVLTGTSRFVTMTAGCVRWTRVE